MISKIITHSGIFHADECLAIALIRHIAGREIPVVRDIPTEADLNDPRIWVIDCGKDYNLSFHNYDHHQDGNLPSACMLVLNDFAASHYISERLYKRLLLYFEPVSEIDINGSKPNEFNFNGYISLLNSFNSENLIEHITNNYPMFEEAIETCTNVIKAQELYINDVLKGLKTIKDATRINNIPVVYDDFPVGWKSDSDYPFFKYLAHVKRPKLEYFGENTNFEYFLHSRDSKLYPIKPTGKELFIHNKLFIATYDNLQDLEEAINNQTT